MIQLKRASLVLALLSVCTAFSACNNNDPLKKFVDQDVKLEVKANGSQVVGTGSLKFIEVSYSTSYRQVCDYYECGGYETRCYGGGQTCTGGGRVCTPVRRCTGGGCTTDTVCHDRPGSCHTTPRECHQEYVRRSCATNCRNEPYQVRHENKVVSPVTVTLKGADASAIQAMHLGVKTNSKFVQAFADSSVRPKGYEYLWDGLAQDQKTVLVAAGKGVKLSPNQTFLTLPQGFRPGDAVTIEALFEPSGSEKDGVSAVGTTVDFPALEFER